MPVFMVRTAKGANWDYGRGIREQEFWAEHAEFADFLVDQGVILLGGPVDSDDPDDIALLAVEADNRADARAAFSLDPWLEHSIFRLKDVRRWTIWLDGRVRDVTAAQGS